LGSPHSREVNATPQIHLPPLPECRQRKSRPALRSRKNGNDRTRTFIEPSFAFNNGPVFKLRVNTPSPISLAFDDDIPPVVRARILYAFRVFAAVYGHRVVDPGTTEHAIRCTYGRRREPVEAPEQLHIPARYFPRSFSSKPPTLVKHRHGEADFYLAYGLDEATGEPDWLGEIFEWISSSHERGVTKRDSIGRVPYSETVFGSQGMSPRKPYATTLMAWMENSLCRGPQDSLPRAPSPLPGVNHIVVCSHDIDFYYADPRSALARLVKNLGISIQSYRSWSFFTWNLRSIFQLFGGKRVGDYLPALLEALRQSDVRSTLFVVAAQAHRRDPEYRLAALIPHLQYAAANGCSVGIHGSYTSLVEGRTLASEAYALQNAMGERVVGTRQHWLRFDTHEKLFEAVEGASLSFDSSLGFADRVGFRNGASFAFPPYDFKRERPHDFLEIPLVLMDGSLEAASRELQENPQVLADEVLSESRKWSWGGVSALWHNPMEPLQVPEAINKVFWRCAANARDCSEKWMSGDEFLACSLSRYQQAGLLEGVGKDA
jgi:hypothetical protein